MLRARSQDFYKKSCIYTPMKNPNRYLPTKIFSTKCFTERWWKWHKALKLSFICFYLPRILFKAKFIHKEKRWNGSDFILYHFGLRLIQDNYKHTMVSQVSMSKFIITVTSYLFCQIFEIPKQFSLIQICCFYFMIWVLWELIR